MGLIWGKKSWFFPKLQTSVSQKIFEVMSSYFYTNPVWIWNVQKWGRIVKTQLLGVRYHPDLDPHRFPLWNSMKSHWKYSENSIKYHYGELILPSIPCACLPLTYRNTLQVFMACFHLVSEAKILILITILIQLGLGVAHLGTRHCKKIALIAELITS